MTGRIRKTLTRASSTALAIVLLPVVAAAQGAPAPGSAGQGPMIVERITSGFLFAPEIKVTRFDRRTSELVGGYAGWLADETFFIGGGGYWMANRSRDRELAYGGVVVGLFAHTDRAVGFGVKSLFGGGRATLVRSATVFDADFDDPRIASTLTTVNLRVREQFFVAEPEGQVVFKLGEHVRLTAGAGYRFTGTERGVRDQLGGATGSIAVQIGGGH